MKESVSAWPNSSPAFRPDANPEADRKIRVAFPTCPLPGGGGRFLREGGPCAPALTNLTEWIDSPQAVDLGVSPLSRRRVALRAYENSVESYFEAKLDHIELSSRDPTPWEGDCLLRAVQAMATDNWMLAGQRIEMSEGPPASKFRGPPICVTVVGLRSAMAVVRRLREMRTRDPSPRMMAQWKR
jgi:hypothetical protein